MGLGKLLRFEKSRQFVWLRPLKVLFKGPKKTAFTFESGNHDRYQKDQIVPMELPDQDDLPLSGSVDTSDSPHPTLKNAPLAEAIFEMHWVSTSAVPGAIPVVSIGGPVVPSSHSTDPNYRLLLSRFFERIRKDFPSHEPLPAASAPDEMVPHIVQHRFRPSPGTWPLTQIGPGVLTFNNTETYTWETFLASASKVVRLFFELYPTPDQLRVAALKLRYINTVDFDYEHNDPLAFLKKLKLDISIPRRMLDEATASQYPELGLGLSFGYRLPRGAVAVKVNLGKKEEKKVVLWEVSMEAKDDDVPQMPERFEEWMKETHRISSGLFLEMTAGELYQQFR